MHVMLGLLGLKIGELHGDLSQTQVKFFFREREVLLVISRDWIH
jgi:hypothetical protein